MTTRVHTHESVEDFMKTRFQELAVRQLVSQTKSTVQNVTLRLPKGEIAAIEKMATFLDMSRQELLFELVGSGMEQAIRFAAKTLKEGPDRDAWIEEMVNTWTAHDEELEDAQ